MLVLDVARFKYPPHWVEVKALWEATRAVDPVSKRPRGWMILGASGAKPCRADVERVCSQLTARGVDVPALPA